MRNDKNRLKPVEKAAPGDHVLLCGRAWRVISVIERDGVSNQAVHESRIAYGATPPPHGGGREEAPWCVVMGGANGSGKTTFALEFLPHYADCSEFINPDLIAAGLSPLNPRTAAIRAGRLVLERIRELAARRMTFGFETTLSGLGHLRTLGSLRQAGYQICLVLVWAPDPELCAARIACRVKAGGHSVSETDLRRRLPRILRHLPRYRALADRLLVFDNTGEQPVLVFEQSEDGERIADAARFDRVRLEIGL